MRRLILGCVAALAAVTVAVPAGGSPAAAQVQPARQAPACDGDLVSASINAGSLPGGGWSVQDLCVDKKDFWTGVHEDRYPYAIGLTTATYADGHVGRLALLVVEVGDTTLALVGMEDVATGALRFAGTIENTTVDASGASAAGQGLAFPPLELATVRVELTDTVGPIPTTTTTTAPEGSGSGGSGGSGGSDGATTTTSTTSTTSTTTTTSSTTTTLP